MSTDGSTTDPPGASPPTGAARTGILTGRTAFLSAPDAPASQEFQCLVVMYHYVREQDLPFYEGVHGLTPTEFSAQLDRLCAAAEPIDWPTLYAGLQGQRSLPKRCFLLTFDDGLADQARTALPILEEKHLRGVFFVPGRVLTSFRMLPAHAIHLLFSRLGDAKLERQLRDELAKRTPGRDWFTAEDSAAARSMYHYESPARARLKYLLTVELPIELRNEVVNALFERFIGASARWARFWYLSWDDLARIESLGHTIGGHGYSHEPYQRLTPAQRRADMRQVAQVLRDGIGADIRPFSFPYGSFDDDTAEACRKSGFVHAFTTESRPVTPGCDPMRLPRIDTINVNAALEEMPTCSNA
jgi:peptidoglycan/xylan/chitin deacetylase (PgdA/CDA1 family)